MFVATLNLDGNVNKFVVFAKQFGSPSYPDFVTHFNEAVIDPTRLELDGVVASNADVDGDGLPNDWELFHFNSLACGAASDPDGDGASNLAEYRAGTDPSRATSVLRLLSCTPDDAGKMTLRFPHAANRLYAVQFTEDFQTWSSLTSAPVYLLGTNLVEWRDETPSASKRFYRVAVVQP